MFNVLRLRVQRLTIFLSGLARDDDGLPEMRTWQEPFKMWGWKRGQMTN